VCPFTGRIESLLIDLSQDTLLVIYDFCGTYDSRWMAFPSLRTWATTLNFSKLFELPHDIAVRSFMDEAFDAFAPQFLLLCPEELRENLVRVVGLWRSRLVAYCKTGYCSEPAWTHSNSEYIDLVAEPRGPSAHPSLTSERVPAAA
jgi:hypothetical protein